MASSGDESIAMAAHLMCMPQPPSPPIHPRHPTHLVGSKWSAVEPAERECHWEIRAFDKASGTVTMRAVLTSRDQLIPWRQLRDRAVWLPGWQ